MQVRCAKAWKIKPAAARLPGAHGQRTGRYGAVFHFTQFLQCQLGDQSASCSLRAIQSAPGKHATAQHGAAKDRLIVSEASLGTKPVGYGEAAARCTGSEAVGCL
jgi:hypothetical protein